MSRALMTVVVLASSALLGACVTGIADDPAHGQRCANPLRGSRFSVCGQLSSSEVGTATVGGRRVLGSLDSTQPATGNSPYTVKGGTFHAYR